MNAGRLKYKTDKKAMGDISFQYPDALQALERAMAIRCAEFTPELVHLQILGVGFHPTDAWGKRPMKPGQIDTRLPSA